MGRYPDAEVVDRNYPMQFDRTQVRIPCRHRNTAGSTFSNTYGRIVHIDGANVERGRPILTKRCGLGKYPRTVVIGRKSLKHLERNKTSIPGSSINTVESNSAIRSATPAVVMDLDTACGLACAELQCISRYDFSFGRPHRTASRLRSICRYVGRTIDLLSVLFYSVQIVLSYDAVPRLR